MGIFTNKTNRHQFYIGGKEVTEEEYNAHREEILPYTEASFVKKLMPFLESGDMDECYTATLLVSFDTHHSVNHFCSSSGKGEFYLCGRTFKITSKSTVKGKSITLVSYE